MNPFIRKHIQTWKAYIPGEQPQQPNKASTTKPIIKLNTNESPFIPPELYADISSLNTEPSSIFAHLNRYPDPNATQLRVIASDVLGIPSEQFVFANGSDELISGIFRAFLDPNDQLTLATPTYGAYEIYSHLYNIAIEKIPLNADFLVSLEALKSTRGKVMFLPNPHAPSGNASSRVAIEALLTQYPQKLFIIDEAYADFAGITLISHTHRYPNLIVLRTFSKAFALAGLRIGYAVGQPALITALRKVLDPYNLNAFSQTLAGMALKAQKTIATHVKEIIATRTWFLAELTKLGFETQPSYANFVLTTPKYFRLATETENLPPTLTNLAKRAQSVYTQLKKERILIRYFSTPELQVYLRITIGTRAEMEQVVTTLRSFSKNKL